MGAKVSVARARLIAGHMRLAGTKLSQKQQLEHLSTPAVWRACLDKALKQEAEFYAAKSGSRAVRNHQTDSPSDSAVRNANILSFVDSIEALTCTCISVPCRPSRGLIYRVSKCEHPFDCIACMLYCTRHR